MGGQYNLEARAEVGLLTHNVVVRGVNNKEWGDTIKACPQGFDTGMCNIFIFYKVLTIINENK